MATKAETFRSASERSGPKRGKAKRNPTSAQHAAAAKNEPKTSARTRRKAAFALEVTPEGRPTRKSSRKSANRQKPDSNLRRRAMRANASPEAQAARAPVKRRPVKAAAKAAAGRRAKPKARGARASSGA